MRAQSELYKVDMLISRHAYLSEILNLARYALERRDNVKNWPTLNFEDSQKKWQRVKIIEAAYERIMLRYKKELQKTIA